jgi:hypothetical protein
MKRILFITGLIFACFACSDSDRATKTLLDAGYTHIKTTGHAWNACGKDSVCTGFTAIGPSGRRVEGAVGCGYNNGCSKGCTIRLD